MPSQFFIGLRLPVSWLVAFCGVQSSLRYRGLSSLDWIDPDCLHVSVQSLGPAGGTLIEQIVMAMDRTAEVCVPFQLRPGVLGIFSHSGHPTFLWAGVKGDLEGLKRTRETLQAELSARGYRREHRELNPHITLARVPKDVGQPLLGRIRGVVDEPVALEEPYQAQLISLIHSYRGPNGWQHECVATAMMAIH